MLRRFGLGLRAQILLALSVAFIASFPLLAIAAVQLTQRAREGDRVAHAQRTVDFLAAALESGADDPRFDALAERLLADGAIDGVELVPQQGAVRLRGAREAGHRVEATLGSGEVVRLWVRRPEPGAGGPLARLLLLYVAVTAGAILLLTYVVLTYLIVRPVESVTQASERLASGAKDAEAPVRGGAEVARLAVAFNDMAAQLRHERQALEERLRELERTSGELRSAQDQVVRSARLASVGRLAAGVAHEIGNPLSAIVGLVELVRAGGLDEGERNEFLERMQNETERIHKIIRDLLDFARRERDDDEQSGRSDVPEVVEEAVRLVAPQKDLRGVNIERRYAEGVPSVRGRSERLAQVVLNLLLNAADAIEGEGTIEVAVEHEPGGQVLLVVEDSGPGIAEDVSASLFEPFVSTKPAGAGTGLGLAVCHTIVERLGGRITATNSPRGGARFEVRLPAAAAG